MVHSSGDQLTLECESLTLLPGVSLKMIDFGKNVDVWLFQGEMGAGKTTLIKEICLAFGIEDTVNSPTFSLVNEYMNHEDEVFYHFDFYRIESEKEAIGIGVEEYFYSGSHCFIEWPSKIPSLIPDEHLEIIINVEDNGKRVIEITKHE